MKKVPCPFCSVFCFRSDAKKKELSKWGSIRLFFNVFKMFGVKFLTF